MSTEQNKAVVRRYFDEVVNQRNPTLANEVLAPDYVNHSAGGGIGTGRAGFIQSLTAPLTAFPDWHITAEEMVAEGDLVVDRFRITATHTGSVNGVPASGRPLVLEGMHMWRVADGRMVEGWYAADALPQLTAALVPATQ